MTEGISFQDLHAPCRSFLTFSLPGKGLDSTFENSTAPRMGTSHSGAKVGWGKGCRVCDPAPQWLGGEIPVSRDLNHQPADFKQSGLHVLVLSLKLSLSHGWGSQILQKNSKMYYSMYSLRGNRDPTPQLCYCLVTALPWFLHSLPSIISNCSKLPFETQGRPRRPKAVT